LLPGGNLSEEMKKKGVMGKVGSKAKNTMRSIAGHQTPITGVLIISLRFEKVRALPLFFLLRSDSAKRVKEMHVCVHMSRLGREK
jgi:hypothetical protein